MCSLHLNNEFKSFIKTNPEKTDHLLYLPDLTIVSGIDLPGGNTTFLPF